MKRTAEEKRTYRRIYAREEYRMRRDLGLCTRCGGPDREEGTRKCVRCNEKHKLKCRVGDAQKKAAGLCHCSAPVSPGKRSCPRCLAMFQERDRVRREILSSFERRCHRCGGVVKDDPKYRTCEDCRKYAREWLRRKKEKMA